MRNKTTKTNKMLTSLGRDRNRERCFDASIDLAPSIRVQVWH
jgi:hypothetical protein